MPRHSGTPDREPCPWRIVDDVGGAFCMGAIGGGIWHSVRGARMAPAGSRLQGSFRAVQARSPVLGGQFAVWGGLFACCDCTLTAIRQKVRARQNNISGPLVLVCVSHTLIISIYLKNRRIHGILLLVVLRRVEYSPFGPAPVPWRVPPLSVAFCSVLLRVWALCLTG